VNTDKCNLDWARWWFVDRPPASEAATADECSEAICGWYERLNDDERDRVWRWFNRKRLAEGG
jgi:hypothetical protein